MPRSARVKSESGFYHVIAKGSGGQLLFEGPADYLAFLDLLRRACEKSGVCPGDEYRWSSYREYVGGMADVADTALLLDMCGGLEGFLAFSVADGEDRYAFGQRLRISEAEARDIAARVLGEIAPADLKTVERQRRNALLFDLRKAGLSVRQIERLTGIGRGTVAKATKG